jgi:hypothetical protein
MSSEVLFESRSRQQREDVAELLEENVAYHLRRGEGIPIGARGDALVAGEEWVTPTPAEVVTVTVTVERETPPDGPPTKRFAVELEWEEDTAADESGSDPSG